MIDYIGLIGASGYTEEKSRIAEISESLKNFAKELPCPLFVLAQLNRNADARKDKTPVDTDLRGSDVIAHNADTLLFLTRPQVEKPQPQDGYQKDNGYASKYQKLDLAIEDPEDNAIDLYLKKQRNGPTGEFRLHFDRASNRFSELAKGNHNG